MDVWDTQIRTGNQYDEKWLYIRQNPVRRGLVKVADDWRSGGRRSAAALTRGAEGAAPSKGAPAHKKRETSFTYPLISAFLKRMVKRKTFFSWQ